MRGQGTSEPPPLGSHAAHHPKPRLPPILINRDNDNTGSSFDGTELMTPRTKKRVTLLEEPTISGPAYAFFPTPSPRVVPSPMTRPTFSTSPAPAPAPPLHSSTEKSKKREKPPPPNITLLAVSWKKQQPPGKSAPARPSSRSAPPPPRPPPPVEPSPRSALKKTSSNFSQRSLSSPPAVSGVSSPSNPSPRSFAFSPPPPPSPAVPMSNTHVNPRSGLGLWSSSSSSSSSNNSNSSSQDNRVLAPGALAGGGGGARGRLAATPMPSPPPGAAATLAPLHEGEEGEEDSEDENEDDSEDEEDRMGSRYLPSLPPRRPHIPPPPPASAPSGSFPASSPSSSSSLSSSSSSSPSNAWTHPHTLRPPPPSQHALPFGGRNGGRKVREREEVEEARELKAIEEGLLTTQEEINRKAPSPRRSRSSSGSSSSSGTTLPGAAAAVMAAQRQQQRLALKREAERGGPHLSLSMPSPSPVSPASPASSTSSSSSFSTASRPAHPRAQVRASGQSDVKAAIRRHLALGPFTSGVEWTMLSSVAAIFLSVAAMSAESAGFFVGYNDFAYTTAGSMNLIDMHIGWNRFSMDVNGAEAVTTRFLDNVSRLAYLMGCLSFVGHFLSIAFGLATLSYLHNLRTHGRLSALGGAYTHTRLLSWSLLLLGLFLAGVAGVGFPWFVLRDFMAAFKDTPQMEGFHLKPGWAYGLSVTVAALLLIMGARLAVGAKKMDTVIARAAGRTRGGRRLQDIVRQGPPPGRTKRPEEGPSHGGRTRPLPPPRPAFLSGV